MAKVWEILTQKTVYNDATFSSDSLPFRMTVKSGLDSIKCFGWKIGCAMNCRTSMQQCIDKQEGVASKIEKYKTYRDLLQI